MKKKGQVVNTLVIMLLSLVGLMVLLGVTFGFKDIFTKITDKNECQIEFLISSFTKSAGRQIVEPECEPHKITITNKELEKQTQKVQENIIHYYETQKGNNIAEQYATYFKVNPEEWAMNEIIAKEMKYCWDLTGRGKLDLFDQWWSLLGCYRDKAKTQPCVKNDFERDWSLESWKNAAENDFYFVNPMNWNVEKPPTFCVLCSRIKFDDVGDKEISSMGSWLANNPVGTVGEEKKISYAAYLQNDAFKGIWANIDSYTYKTDQAYAVLYARINVLKVEDWMHTVKEITFDSDEKAPESVQVIKLVPYNSISQECTYLVG